ncbi:sensor histidine kinase [Niabella drilacis]|uniref:histidine kinase n=1 Tax=Niabella drilacis (strain DSM 25811 / CCM 8410 / CCUG 62505 / LMG 26954 / E90) TaxID=1285928 RepID=A0A1G6IJQ7_NIADE|nr:HAMP domain-containing sensor histidine kinase [Niabella drilacis]SDC06812.1 Signal transduction histidine kinase [Niabella drilacis]
MRKRSLKNFTLRYLVLAILGVIGIWAGVFYVVIIEEVYDNIDDGLKDSKDHIIKEAASDPGILNTNAFGIAQFKITKLPGGWHETGNQIYNSKLYIPQEDDEASVRMLRTVFKKDDQFYRLEVYASTVEEDDLIENILTALVMLYIALVLSILLLNHILLKKAWKPFYRILEKLRPYKLGAAGKFECADQKIREFDDLEKDLAAMIQRNESIYTQQKQFIENAAHELQTPLAIASGKLELFMDEGSLTERQLLKIEEVSNTLNRLKRMNRSLLMLSKIENNQFRAAEKVNFNKIFNELADEYDSLIQFKAIQVQIQENGVFEFEMNRELAIVLVSNLLKNAIVHSEKDKWVEITITSGSFRIQNEGTLPLDEGFIFERFSKGKQNAHSTGLGLSICQSICNLYGNMRFRYFFKEGHCFEVAVS